MKQAILILICYIIRVKSQAPDWAPRGIPLITNFPCEQNYDIVTWYDPSLPPREKNRYYVYIHKVIPENSRLLLDFTTDVTVTMNCRTEDKKFVRFHFDDGPTILLRFFQTIHTFGFIVKGSIPGIIPYFNRIQLNSEELCRRPEVDYLEHYMSETLNHEPQKNCGVRKNKLRKTSHTGSVAKPGDWPWHAAVYRFDETELKYICGGTLISKTFVLTAAHCASIRGVPLSPEVLHVFLGLFNLKHRSSRTQEKEVKTVIIHEWFEYNHLYSDIALLRLKTEAKFTIYVQPACLWYSKAVDKLPNGTIVGTVVGWGLSDGSTSVTNRLKQINMPMVSETTCILSDIIYGGLIVDDSKFCAGFHNGTSACNGDSGSAFQVFVPDEAQNSEPNVSGAWYVRGIVSLSAAKLDSTICDPNKYVLFTDVENYRMWIDAYIDNEDY